MEALPQLQVKEHEERKEWESTAWSCSTEGFQYPGAISFPLGISLQVSGVQD